MAHIADVAYRHCFYVASILLRRTAGFRAFQMVSDENKSDPRVHLSLNMMGVEELGRILFLKLFDFVRSSLISA